MTSTQQCLQCSEVSVCCELCTSAPAKESFPNSGSSIKIDYSQNQSRPVCWGGFVGGVAGRGGGGSAQDGLYKKNSSLGIGKGIKGIEKEIYVVSGGLKVFELDWPVTL